MWRFFSRRARLWTLAHKACHRLAEQLLQAMAALSGHRGHLRAPKVEQRPAVGIDGLSFLSYQRCSIAKEPPFVDSVLAMGWLCRPNRQHQLRSIGKNQRVGCFSILPDLFPIHHRFAAHF
jgi:hypothetical protein